MKERRGAIPGFFRVDSRQNCFSRYIKNIDIGVEGIEAEDRQGWAGSSNALVIKVDLCHGQGLGAFLLLNEETGLIGSYWKLMHWASQEFYPRKSPNSKIFSLQKALATLTKGGLQPALRVELFWEGRRLLRVHCRDLLRARQCIKTGGEAGLGEAAKVRAA